MGGCWEKLVRSLKTALKVILKERVPSEDTLITALTKAESVINSRPLTYVSLDHRDEKCLTPNHFLSLNSEQVRNPTDLENQPIDMKKQWQQACEISNHFKKRWVREYLPTLTRRTKWFAKVKPIQKEDVVVICDGLHNGTDWKRGIVENTVMGAGNQVRAAFVRTADGKTKKYPAVRLAVINVKLVNDV